MVKDSIASWRGSLHGCSSLRSAPPYPAYDEGFRLSPVEEGGQIGWYTRIWQPTSVTKSTRNEKQIK